jgi:Ca2+-binding RTX toxin-like protein
MSRQPRSFRFEPLEKRNLLAAGNILLEHGYLGFRGTGGDDVMGVEHIGNYYQLTLNGRYALVDASAVWNGIIIDGRAGNDQITIDSSVNVFTGVLGGKGNDTIQGGSGQNYLFGDAGNDTIYSGAPGSWNLIGGGPGDDVIHCGNAGTEAHGDAGNDLLVAGSTPTTMYGGPGNDTLEADGNGPGDTLWAGPGDDLLRGNGDVMNGEAGNDTILGGKDGDWCTGGKGNDVINAGDGEDTVRGDEGRDQLFGDLGDDTIHGGAGNDLLRGGDGLDWLYGDEGNDSIYGDEEPDLIDGGLGNDICLGGDGDDWLNGGLGRNQLDGEAGNNIFNTTNPSDTLLNGVPGDTSRNLMTYIDGPDYWVGGSAYAGGYYFTSPYGFARQEVLNQDGVLTYRLTLYIHGLQENTTYHVLIDGIQIAQVVSDGGGSALAPPGEPGLVFSTNPTGNEQPFPAGFPGVQEGSMIQIEDLASGIFQPLAFGALA